MNNITRELHIQKWFFIITVPLGLILPIFDGISNMHHFHQRFRSDCAVGVVSIAGPLLAILVAATCCWFDLCGNRESFWRSRPVTTKKLFNTRLLCTAVLLTLSLTILIIPDLFDKLTRTPIAWDVEPWSIYSAALAVSIMLFTLTTYLMALTRDITRSVIIALWFGFLLICVPLVLDFPNWMNLFTAFEARIYSHRPGVIGIMVLQLSGQLTNTDLNSPMGTPYWNAITVITLIYLLGLLFHLLTIRAINKDTRFKPGIKTLVWSLALSMLLIFMASIRQVGSNLEVMYTIEGRDLPLGGCIRLPRTQYPEEISSHIKGKAANAKIDDTKWHPQQIVRTISPDKCELYVVSYIYSPNDNVRRIQGDTNVNYGCILSCYNSPTEMLGKIKDLGGRSPSPTAEILLSSTKDSVYHNLNSQGIAGMEYHNGYLYIVRDDFALPLALPDIIGPKRKSILQVVDVKDPYNPKLLSTMRTPYALTILRHDSYLYLISPRLTTIVSIANPLEIEIAREIQIKTPERNTLRHYISNNSDTQNRQSKKPHALGVSLENSNWGYLPCGLSDIHSDRILLSDRFSEMILSVANPLDPRVIFYRNAQPERIGNNYSSHQNIKDIALSENCYYMTSRAGIEAVQFKENDDGTLTLVEVGGRKATKLEYLADRYPSKLFLTGNYLLEDGGPFGLLVYDISDPAHPRRKYHCSNLRHGVSQLELWGDIIVYIDNIKLRFLKLPDE